MWHDWGGSGCRNLQALQALVPQLQERSHQMAADALRSRDREGALPWPDLRSPPAVHPWELGTLARPGAEREPSTSPTLHTLRGPPPAVRGAGTLIGLGCS